MEPTIIERKEIKVIGIEARTSNKAEMSGEGKIGAQWDTFYQQGLDARIPNQAAPGTVMAIYTDYESDVNGEYSFILGAEVTSLDNVPAGMVAKTLPASRYALFTSRKGAIPDIIIEIWQHIWSLKPGTVGGDRAYKADFEFYDGRAANMEDAQIDLFLSIK